MGRTARIVSPGVPYHITHRGNRRQNVFLDSKDFEVYKGWLLDYSARHGFQIWSYCLMSNHVHLIGVPEQIDSLAIAIGRTHGRFAQWQNRRREWSGHLWANRYYSTPLEPEHLWAAARYVELNPVRAGLADRAELYEWSSARCHALGVADPLLSPHRPFPGHVQNWTEWLRDPCASDEIEIVRQLIQTAGSVKSRLLADELEANVATTLRA